MSAPQNFRSAFNGFNRDDVVRYLEYINAKHTAQVNQLTSEADYLRSKLETRQDSENQQEQITALQAEVAELKKQLEEAREALAQQRTAAPAEVPAVLPTPEQELEAYRRAERTERIAKERAELVYHQVNGVLADATVKVDAVATEISTMADQVMLQLSQLQGAVSTSKQALKDAAATMYAIRPDNQ